MVLAVRAAIIQVLMREPPTFVWEQLRGTQVSYGAALSALFNEFGSIPLAALFCFPSAFVIPSICTFYYFAGAVQDCVDEIGGLTLLQHLYPPSRWEMSLGVIDGLAVEFPARGWM